MNIEVTEQTDNGVRTITGELISLQPELVRFIKALARMAARQDYEHFCRTGAVLGYDGGVQE